MRDIALVVVFSALLLYSVPSPPRAIYLWSWVSFMSPHKLAWTFTATLPFAQISFIVLLVSMLISGRKLQWRWNALVAAWMLLLLVFVISTVFAIRTETAFLYSLDVAKVQLVSLLTVMLIHTLRELRILITVIVFSIGFFGIKGGIFTLVTGGAHRVFGPTGSYIYDNNYLATALLIILPLFFYLLKVTADRRYRALLWFSIGAISLSILGSWSRGAFLGAIAVFGFFWLKSQRKLLAAVAITLLALIALPLMPGGWSERMESIRTYQEDASANSRLYSWGLSMEIAKSRPFGGGFRVWGVDVETAYTGEGRKGHVAHSIYFHVLGEHGYPGLLLFLLVLLLCWRQCKAITRLGENDERLAEYAGLGRMLQICLVAYCTGGAFISIAYFDLTWSLVAIILIARRQCDQVLSGDTSPLENTAKPPPSVLGGGPATSQLPQR